MLAHSTRSPKGRARYSRSARSNSALLADAAASLSARRAAAKRERWVAHRRNVQTGRRLEDSRVLFRPELPGVPDVNKSQAN